MGMHQVADRLEGEFDDCFGTEGADFGRITYRQLWFIVKVAKGARLYCRSNKAFNNFFNSIFGKVARFEQITKTKPNQEEYEGLKITMIVDGNDAEDDSYDGEDDTQVLAYVK